MSAEPPLPAQQPEGVGHTAAELGRRARFGAIALTLRAIALQITVLIGGVALRRLLAVADFGAISIAQVALQFFFLFGDAGLGGALIQQKDHPSQRELSSIWCLQILLSFFFIAVVWFAAPALVRFWPGLTPHTVWLFRALSVELLLTAVRVVPSVLMERELQYGRLSILEVLLVIPYYLVAIALARAGFGVYALVGAILAQGVFGVVGAFAMRPWRPSLVLDFGLLRPILRFGITYQAKSVVGVIAAAITPVYAGRVLGQTVLGLIDFGRDTAYFPLRLVDIISRVSFPLYSRMQHDRALLARTLERSVQLCAVATLFYVGLILGLGPNIVSVVYSAKWLPAVPALYVFAVAIAFGFLAPIIMPALDATGDPRLSLRLSIAWTVGIAVLAPLTTPLGKSLGAGVGFAVGASIPTVLGNCAMMFVLKKLIPGARFWHRTRAAIAGCLVIAAGGSLWLAPWATGVVSLVVSLVAMFVAFSAVAIALDRDLVPDAVALFRKNKPAA